MLPQDGEGKGYAVRGVGRQAPVVADEPCRGARGKEGGGPRGAGGAAGRARAGGAERGGRRGGGKRGDHASGEAAARLRRKPSPPQPDALEDRGAADDRQGHVTRERVGVGPG